MRHRVAASYLKVSMVVLLIVGFTGISASSSASAQSAIGTVQTSVASIDGVYPGNGGQAEAAAFGAFEGSAPQWITAYLTGGTGWESVDNPWSSSLSLWAGSPYRVDWSVPIINESGETLEQGAAGIFDNHYWKLGTALVAAGQSNAVLRLGWEFGGSYMPWSAGSDPAAFAEYWRQIVTTMRAVPGEHFAFDWNGGGGSNWDVEEAYPGDAYVDYISADVFDQSWNPATGYGNNTATAAGYQTEWNGWLTNLDWMASFAAEHNKPMGFPEWGVAARPDGHGGGDDPYFIQQMYNFMTTHNVAFEMYFEFDASDGQHSLLGGEFPQSAALFQRLF